MSAPEPATNGPGASYERAAAPGPPATAAAYGALPPDDELAAITHRAGQIGIPAWRVVVALGLPLPPPS